MCLATMFFMVFGWFIILGVILISILVLGITLLVIGIVTRKRNDKNGIEKKYPKICTIIGSVLTVIPLVILGVMLVTYMVDSKNSEYNPDTYDPHKSNSLQDEEYCKGIMTEVIRCLDEEDAEGLKSLFSDYSIANSNLDSEIEVAMDVYNGTSIACEGYRYSLGGYYVEGGYFYSKGSTAYMESVVTDTGKEFYIECAISLANKDTSKEGIIIIWIRDSQNNNESLVRIGDVNY